MTDIAISSGEDDSTASGTKGAARPGSAAVAGVGGGGAAGADVGRITRVGVPIGSEGLSGTSGNGTEGGAGAGEKEDVFRFQSFLFVVACDSGGGDGGHCTLSLGNITRHIYFPFPIYPGRFVVVRLVQGPPRDLVVRISKRIMSELGGGFVRQDKREPAVFQEDAARPDLGLKRG